MPYHTSTQAPDVSSAVVVSGCQTKKVDIMVLKRVFWCFQQCVANFAHCRPIISVDATFLIGKYKGTLMVIIGMTAGNQLLPLAFALVKGENNES
jgi:hypothetical protein